MSSIVKSSSAASISSKEFYRKATARAVAAKTSESANFIYVKRKLKQTDKYKGLDANGYEEMVDELTNPERIMELFSHLLGDTFIDAVTSQHFVTDKTDLEGPEELRDAKEREQRRFGKVASIPVKLYLKDLEKVKSKKGKFFCFSAARLLDMDFGGQHAAIMVGDVVLEWNTTSLVIPSNDDDERFHFSADIGRFSGYHADAAKSIPPSAAPVQEIKEEIDLLFDTAAKKRDVLYSLAKLISKYNSSFYYNVVVRNCQTFVQDCFKVLEIPKRPTFSNQLEKHFQQVKQGKVKAPDVFQKHEDVDAHVSTLEQRDELESAHLDDLECLLIAYLQHHNGKPCSLETCKVMLVKDVVERKVALVETI